MASNPFIVSNKQQSQKAILSRVGQVVTSIFKRALRILLLSGNGQTAVVNSTLPLPLVVEIRDIAGNLVPDARVDWYTVNQGQFETTHSFTQAEGTASILYTVDDIAGTGSVTASVNITDWVGFTIYKTAGSAVQIIPFSAVDQTALPDTIVSSSPAVKVLDDGSNPVANYPVTFSVVSGAGTLIGSTTSSNADGIAQVGSWTTGPAVGVQIVRCSGSTDIAGSSILFTANVVAAQPTQITTQSGNNQTDTVAGASASLPLVVLVRDVSNNPVQNQTVFFSIFSDVPAINFTGSTVSPSSMLTNESGLASTSLVSSTTSGTIYVLAYFSDATGSPISTYFTSSTTFGTKNKIGVEIEPSSNARSGESLVIQPQLVIQDINSNRVMTATDSVTASIFVGNATIIAGAATQSIQGRATFRSLTITDIDNGSTILEFNAPGLIGVSSSTIVIQPPVPYDLQFASTIANGTVGSTLTSFNVNIQDGSGNIVVGSSNNVSLLLSGSGGEVGGTTTKTAVAGVATFSDITISQIGSWKLFATAAGLVSATSSLFSIEASSGANPQHPNEPVGFSRIAEVDFTAQTTLPSNTTYQPYGAAGYWYSNRGHVPSNPSAAGGWRVQFPVGTTEGSTPNTLHVRGGTAANPPTYSEVYIHVKGYRVGMTVAEGGDGQFEQNGHGEKLVFIRMGDLNTGAVIMKNRGPGAPSRVVSQYGFRGGWDGGGNPPTVDYNGTANLMQTAVECELEYYLKVNTPDVANGVLKQWLNGTLINSLNISNGLWRVTGKSLNVYELWFDPTYGGGGGGITKTRTDYIFIKSIYWSGII